MKIPEQAELVSTEGLMRSRRNLLLAGATASAVLAFDGRAEAADAPSSAMQQMHPDIAEELAPEIILDAPSPGSLAHGVVLIAFKTVNLKIVPVYGRSATKVVPRIGHLHVTVDEADWFWIHATDEPIYYGFLKPGPHRILVELARPDHTVIEARRLEFVVPKTS
jgi:hypothetical protein